MEGLNNVTTIKNEERSKTENQREFIFETLILEEIINAFIEDLEEAGFDKEEVDKFLIEINNYDNETIKSILAIPKELREKNFKNYKKEIDDGKTDIKQIVSNLKNTSTKNGYTLGYHTSKSDIMRKNGSWEVAGKELDDRDDMTMAYYSLDYKNIYRIDRGNKMYVVRAKVGEDTEHKRDTSNNWGRATSLSIVHKINLTDIDEKVEEKLRELKNKKERDAA